MVEKKKREKSRLNATFYDDFLSLLKIKIVSPFEHHNTLLDNETGRTRADERKKKFSLVSYTKCS